ncbi:IclR family transcriptional regulator [Nocardioidaceae bacterium SCSIO 66511]|nr:IclR family transcriptional regulator [Nocardioidaceae bacterium SCSIO 66511]
MSNGTQSIDRAAEVLSLVVRSEEPVTYTQVVEMTDLARSTVSRLLQALERNGLLERDKDGRFRGGALFAQYAARFDRVESLAAAAEPSLERVGEETGETVNLGVPSGDTVVHVAQVDSTFVLGATNWVDVEVPPHTSALGKVMYAYDALPMPRGPLQRRTPATLTSRAKLERELRDVRELGYAVTHGEFEEGLDAVAAPVHGPDGAVHAALGISGPSLRLADEHRRYGELLVTEAEMLSKVLSRRLRKNVPH